MFLDILKFLLFIIIGLSLSSVALSFTSLGILRAFDFYPSKKLFYILIIFFIILVAAIFFGAGQYDESNISNRFILMGSIYGIGVISMGFYLKVKHFSYESGRKFILSYGVIFVADGILLIVLMNILAAFAIVLIG